MVDKRRGTWMAMVRASTVAICVATGLTGCQQSIMTSLSPARRLTADDFSTGPVDRAMPIAPYVPERPRAPRVEIRSLSEAEAKGGVRGIDVAPGEPPKPPPADAAANTPDGADLTASELVLVDAKVGDLNGWPVLARSWLEPMGARLRAEAAGKTPDAWRRFAAEEINKRLITDLRDELFLAEARSTLTAEEKVGLRVFLQRFEQDVERGAYGSRTLAEERLRQTSGMGLVEAKRERERAALIENEVRNKVWDRVQVSSRDLRLEYERNYDKYNPPPNAIFRRIRVRTSETETVEAFRTMLAERPFDEVADDPRNGTPDPEPRRLPDGDLAKADLYGIPALQEAASTLTPGKAAGPIEAGAFTYWLYLDRIESESKSLYDVQLALRDQITGDRREEEARRYLLRLFDRAGISGLDTLTLRLVEIAERWYYTPGAG
ncbi:MAG: hypothetical protein IPJ41_08635 [Phycisphaerales bacterium]|nr:hypothetical protein [Phycisphaerales bacterium]